MCTQRCFWIIQRALRELKQVQHFKHANSKQHRGHTTNRRNTADDVQTLINIMNDHPSTPIYSYTSNINLITLQLIAQKQFKKSKLQKQHRLSFKLLFDFITGLKNIYFCQGENVTVSMF